jgi:hypothetical protein
LEAPALLDYLHNATFMTAGQVRKIMPKETFSYAVSAGFVRSFHSSGFLYPRAQAMPALTRAGAKGRNVPPGASIDSECHGSDELTLEKMALEMNGLSRRSLVELLKNLEGGVRRVEEVNPPLGLPNRGVMPDLLEKSEPGRNNVFASAETDYVRADFSFKKLAGLIQSIMDRKAREK